MSVKFKTTDQFTEKELLDIRNKYNTSKWIPLDVIKYNHQHKRFYYGTSTERN